MGSKKRDKKGRFIPQNTENIVSNDLFIPNHDGLDDYSRTQIQDWTTTNLKVDHIQEKTTGHNVVFDNDVDLGANDLILDTGIYNVIISPVWPGIAILNEAKTGNFPIQTNQLLESEQGGILIGDIANKILEYSSANSKFGPTANNHMDLGTTALRWKNLWLSGNANITGDLNVTGDSNLKGNLEVGSGGGGYNASNYSLVGGDADTAGITASDGSIAYGKVNFGGLTASGGGSAVFGRGQGGDITASGEGSFATGYTTGTAITASGDNSQQFGIGTNATANSFQVGVGILIEHNGNLTFKGAGKGLPFGSFYGNEFNQSQVMTTNTEYQVAHASIATGQSNNITTDGNGKFTITKAGKYHVVWHITASHSVVGKHVLWGIALDQLLQNDGQHHRETIAADKEYNIGGDGIIDVAVGEDIEIGFKSADGTPGTALISHMSLSVVQVGG